MACTTPRDGDEESPREAGIERTGGTAPEDRERAPSLKHCDTSQLFELVHREGLLRRDPIKR